MKFRYKRFANILVFFTILFPLMNTMAAMAFPFREFNSGDPVPDVTLNRLAGTQGKVTFSSLAGTPFIALFWGADLPRKAEHSTQILSKVGALAPFFHKRHIRLLSINVQGDDPSTIKKIIDNSQSGIEVYADHDRAIYGKLGLFVMPTILLVDKDGVAVAGYGYSPDVVDRLKGAVEIMLGEKPPEQVQAELGPQIQEMSTEEKISRRHMHLGLIMMRRGHLETALRELSKAIEIVPDLVQANYGIGCIYLKLNQLENAEKYLVKADALGADFVDTEVCYGELNRLKGNFGEAIKGLKDILQADPENFKARYILGKVYVDQNRQKEAMSEFKKAYNLIVKKSADDGKEAE